MTSFLDQFSLWQILGALAVLMVGNTLLFRMVVNWDRSHPVDEAGPAGAESAVPSLASAAGAGVSFATASKGNRPRRRKHLQQESIATAASVPESPDPESDQPEAEPPYPSWPAAPAGEPAPEAARPGLVPASAQETSQPVVAFTSSTDPAVVPVPPLEPAKIDRLAFAPSAFSENNHGGSDSEPVPVLGRDSEPASEPEPAVILAQPEHPSMVVAASLPVAPALETPPAPEPIPALAPTAIAASAQPASDLPDVKPSKSSHPTSDLISAPIIPVESGAVSLQSVPPATGEEAAHGVSSTSAGTMSEKLSPSEQLMDAKLSEADEPPPREPEPAAPVSTIPEPPTPIRPPTTTPLIRRAVGPPRLFLTREFSSLRIRSRSTASPKAPAPSSLEPAPAAPTQPPAPEEMPVPVAELPAIPPAAPAAETPTSSFQAEAPTDPPTEPLTSEVAPTSPPVEEPAALTLSAGPVEPVAPEPVVVVVSTLPPAAEEPMHPVVAEHAPEPIQHEAAAEPAPSEPAVADFSQHREADSAPEPIFAAPAPEPEPPAAPAPAFAEPRIHAEEEAPAPAIDIAAEPAIVPPVSPDLTIHHPPLAPTQTHMATVQPSTGERASAQLTLSFEVSSLQLTPAFKLGSVQLKPLSNVVSLQLGAGDGPQPAANPLAANVSFEILSVQTGGNNHVQSLVLRPLPQAQAATTPQPRLQVDAVQLTRGVENAPIQITPAQQTSTAVQVLATYTVVGIDFTPLFEIGSMRLEPNSNTVLLRLSSPTQGGMADLPPVFELASVQVGADGQISLVQLTPAAV